MSKLRIWCIVIGFAVFGYLITGCNHIEPTQIATPPLATTSPTQAPSHTPAPTHTVAPSPSLTPTAPPTQSSISLTSPTPWPTILESTCDCSSQAEPTATPDPQEADLPRRLIAAITLQSAKGVNGHPLRQITGWPQGIASYHWLDNAHLLLYPTIREYHGPVVLPMVMNLNNGKTWLPATDGPAYLFYGDLALWSSSLKRLISSQGQEVLLYDLQGKITQRFAGYTALHHHGYCCWQLFLPG